MLPFPTLDNLENQGNCKDDIFQKKDGIFDVNLGKKVEQACLNFQKEDFMQPEINQLFLDKNANYMAFGNDFAENEIFGLAGQCPDNMSGLGSPRAMRSLSPKQRFSQDVHHEHQPSQLPQLINFENSAKFFEDSQFQMEKIASIDAGSNRFGSNTAQNGISSTKSRDGFESTYERVNSGGPYPCTTPEEQSTLHLTVEKRDSDYSTQEFEE